MRNWFPYNRRGMAQGLLWMFGRWGGAVAPALILILSSAFGWRGAFWAFGILGAVWVLAFALYFRDTPEEHPGVNEAERELIHEGAAAGATSVAPPLSWANMLGSRTLWCLCLMYFCSNAGWCFFITWDKKYYEVVLGLTDTPLAIASGAPLFFGGIACLVGGFLTDRLVKVLGRRWGRTLQGLVSYFLGGSFFLLALTTQNPWLAVPCLCIASFLKDFAMAASWSTCIDIGHRYSGTVAGFMNMVGNLGTFVSPPIVAHLAKHGQWELALVYSACMFFGASAGWLFINPKRVVVYLPEDRRRLGL
jgi:nitrate/nitrite transporter NarK